MVSPQRARVCVPVCERSLAQTKLAIDRAANAGDLIELRLDCLAPAELDGNWDTIDQLLADGSRFVITFRPAEQGGCRELDVSSRLRFWDLKRHCQAEFLDLELDLCGSLSSSIHRESPDWKRVICSHHDFVGVPADLPDIYKRMIATPARVLKIAVQASDVVDCLPLFKLLEKARAEDREMIAIGMGSAGLLTRILGPSRGGFFTYGSLDHDHATAPGQITAGELREIYHVDSVDRETQITGLVGLPVSHSASPQLHNAAFADAGFDGLYVPLEVHDLGTFFRRMVQPRTREFDWNLRGLSITAPYKTAVINHLDWIDAAATEIGAVNTILVEDDGLKGFNFDASALIQSLTERMGHLRGLNCAVIGTGGVAHAAIYVLSKEKAQVTVYARDVAKARALTRKFDGAYASLESANFEAFDVVINATPLGTAGRLQQETPATAGQLRGARLAYDLVYNPPETQFIREARAAGCQTESGLSMLINQAGAQFRLWTGIEPPLAAMQAAALRALS
jgi:3-dehydroquinate dehydratase / shikimate dehydrogenase